MKSIPSLTVLVCGVASATTLQPQCAHPQQHILSDQCQHGSLKEGPTTQHQQPYNHPTWSHKPLCIAKRGQEYCTHTSRNFRSSHGLSLISTTRASLAISVAFPFTHDSSSDTSVTGPGPAEHEPFEVRLMPGKGLGIVATQHIPRASIILLDSPRIVASAQFPSYLSKAEGLKLFSHALSQLPDSDREKVLSLDKSLGGTPIEDIMKTNAFACQIHDGGQDDSYMCLFPSVARINHACRPNAHARFIPKSLMMEIKALRDINVGEEIEISYGRVDLKHAERQTLYKEGWNFTCTCNMCTSSPYAIAGSDQRRARFSQIRRNLNNLTPATYDAQQIVSWEQEVVELGKKEGLDVLLAADYERLAYVYAGHGMGKEAIMWAGKARESLLEWTVVDGGPRNELRRVEELLAELGG
jgi:hypothetical protein